MSATTVNAFPPLHEFNSSRSWFLALIVLLHAGFFWVLTHGVTVGSVKIEPKMVIDFLPSQPQPPPPPRTIPLNPDVSRVFVPPVETPNLPTVETPNEPIQGTEQPQPPVTIVVDKPGSGPLIVDPQADPRYPFTEPEYPIADIRMGHEGTVWLSIEILPNGRVGKVQVDQSSGFVRLDESAVREARKWRMKPGMQDGVATSMWKRVPITFQLKD
jgi:periplasmic protein TonB